MPLSIANMIGVSGGGGASGPVYAAESLAFFARLSTQPTSAQKLKYDTLIRSLVTAGVWSKLDALYLFSAADSATALTNLASSSYNATLTGAPAFTADVGFTGGTGKAINTNFNPSTAGGKCVQDDAHVSVWKLGSAGEAKSAVGTATGSKFYIDPRYSDNAAYARIFASGGAGPYTSGDGSGFYLISKESSSSQKLYSHGNAYSFTIAGTTSSTPDNSPIVFLSGADGASSGTVTFGSIGSQLTSSEVAALYAAVRRFVCTRTFVSFGDSIPHGTGLTQPDLRELTYSRKLITDLWANQGVVACSVKLGHPSHGYIYTAGGTQPTLGDLAVSEIYPLLNDPGVTVCLDAATNDMWTQLGDQTGEAAYAAMVATAQGLINAGLSPSRLLVVPCRPRQSSATFVSRFQAYNALVVAGAATYGYVAPRLDLNATLGQEGNQNNTAYYPDLIHWTAAAHALFETDVLLPVWPA